MTATLEFTLNGKARQVEADPRRNLLEVLREDLGLTGAKYGCGEGQCRSCMVLLDGRPIQSCLTRIDAVAGHRVETIEGLVDGERLHPVQRAFIEAGAMQCGYCVPGMILNTVALLRENDSPTRAEIIEALDGNLCRCCGYGNILRAVELAAKSGKEAATR
ncbi:MAG TPA: (2Fe-2S)-binding protein [Methylomirabilota bacterium]|nr:(2Fe-2S)-binding protein [Methylomirabilota bacterium]